MLGRDEGQGEVKMPQSFYTVSKFPFSGFSVLDCCKPLFQSSDKDISDRFCFIFAVSVEGVGRPL